MAHDLSEVAIQISKLEARCQDVKLITIDGPAGSGKTTLAKQLSSHLDDCPIISMDDLYDGWRDALNPELWQRIYDQILEPFLQDNPAQIQKFDWKLRQFTDWVTVPVSSHLIIEGVGASHPFIANCSVLNIWIEADQDLLLDRVLKRDGEEIRDEMLRWQLLEKAYFDEYSIKQNADLHLIGM